MRYKKPNMSLLRSSRRGMGVIGENSLVPTMRPAKKRGIYRFASRRGRQYTKSELGFEKILMNLGDGALRGKYKRVHPFKDWILDFYLYEVGLGIDIDDIEAGSQIRKNQKTADCESAGIVLVRFSKREVFGNQKLLVDKLRMAYKEALDRSRKR